jgi:hypothetical protein
MKFSEGIQYILAKWELSKDPWDLFNEWMKLESDIGVRSTFYIVPPHKPQLAYPHKYHEVSYNIPWNKLNNMRSKGWEIAVHGMNNWISEEEGRKERELFGACGNRTHWLLRDDNSWKLLDRAGYDYDATFGYNDNIGIPATQIFKPGGVNNLLVVPLNIQDIALFGKACWTPQNDGTYIKQPCLNLSVDEAKKSCREIFRQIKECGGIVTISWHYQNIVPPNDWREVYLFLIDIAKKDGAWITTAQNAVDWYRKKEGQ